MEFPIEELCGQIRAVVVDRNQSDLDLTCHLLRAAASPIVDAVPFTDPAEALSELGSQEPDVILVHSALGDCTGAEFLESARGLGVDAPAILLGSRDDGEVSGDFRRAGFLDSLPKDSLSERSLKRAVENVIEKHFLSLRAESYRQKLESTVRELEETRRESRGRDQEIEHELMAPLNVARELVSIMVDGLQGSISDGQRDLLSSVLASCDQLGRSLESFFEEARSESQAPTRLTEPDAPDRQIPA